MNICTNKSWVLDVHSKWTLLNCKHSCTKFSFQIQIFIDFFFYLCNPVAFQCVQIRGLSTKAAAHAEKKKPSKNRALRIWDFSQNYSLKKTMLHLGNQISSLTHWHKRRADSVQDKRIAKEGFGVILDPDLFFSPTSLMSAGLSITASPALHKYHHTSCGLSPFLVLSGLEGKLLGQRPVLFFQKALFTW